MHKLKEKYLFFWGDILGLQPLTVDGRNCCRVLYRDGSCEDVHNTPEQVLNHIATICLRTNLVNLRNSYRQVTEDERSRNVPILFNPSRVFVPIRMPSVYPDDSIASGCETGYISLTDYWMHCRESDGIVKVFFRDTDESLPCGYTSATVERLMQRAREYLDRYRDSRDYYRQEQRQRHELGELIQQVAALIQTDDHTLRSLSTQEVQFLILIYEKPECTYQEILSYMKCSRYWLHEIVESLKMRDLVWRSGSRKKGHWRLALELQQMLDASYEENPGFMTDEKEKFFKI